MNKEPRCRMSDKQIPFVDLTRRLGTRTGTIMPLQICLFRSKAKAWFWQWAAHCEAKPIELEPAKKWEVMMPAAHLLGKPKEACQDLDTNHWRRNSNEIKHSLYQQRCSQEYCLEKCSLTEEYPELSSISPEWNGHY